jgi:hypothetical protein
MFHLHDPNATEHHGHVAERLSSIDTQLRDLVMELNEQVYEKLAFQQRLEQLERSWWVRLGFWLKILPLAIVAILAAGSAHGQGTIIPQAAGAGGTQYAQGTTQATPTGTVALGIGPSNVLHAIVLDSSSNLFVNCAAGCSAAGAFTDTGTFTGGSTTFTNTGGVFNDGLAALSSGTAGAFRVTATRDLHVNLRNNSGTEIGTAGTPLQISLANTGANATAINVAVAAALPAGTNVIGHVITDSASVTAATQSGNWTARIVGNAGGVLDAAGQNAASPANELLTACQFNTSPTTITSTNVSPVQCDNAGNTLVKVNVALPAGTNVIGHVITDSGSVTNATLSAETTKVIGTVNQGTSPWIVAGGGTAGTAATGVITVQGIASMTKLLVTPDSVALPANQSVNVSQFGGTNVVTGTGAGGSGIPRVTVSNDSNVLATESGTWTVQPGNTPNTSAWLVQTVPGTTNGLTFYNLEPTASDNHANIKNGAGLVYHIAATNNSATINYLRLYNAATGFNGCNSATNLQWEVEIPASTSGAGFVEDIAEGITFATGISICVTGAYGQTNTTNATASAIEVNVGYK